MTWFGWLLITLWWLSATCSVGLIGRPREPYTPQNAVIQVLTAIALTAGVLTVGAT